MERAPERLPEPIVVPQRNRCPLAAGPGAWAFLVCTQHCISTVQAAGLLLGPLWTVRARGERMDNGRAR